MALIFYAISQREMTYHAACATQDTTSANLRTTRNGSTSANYAVCANVTVMSDLHLIVDLHANLDYRILDRTAVYGLYRHRHRHHRQSEQHRVAGF